MTEKEVKTFIDQCLGVDSIVEKEEYNFNDTFYSTKEISDIYKEIREGNISFPDEYIEKRIERELEENHKDTIKNIIKEAYEEYKEEIEEIKISNELTKKEKAEELLKLKKEIHERIKEEILELKDEIREEIIEEENDGLAYWSTYYSPARENIEAAIECNLIPFYYENKFYLALSGCGMDLSPLLDAYQALVDKTLPKNTKLIMPLYKDYCLNVLGKTLYEKALESAKREKPQFVVYFEEPEE